MLLNFLMNYYLYTNFENKNFGKKFLKKNILNDFNL